MIEFYAEIRLVHITAVIASGSLFLLRGLLVQAGHGDWALAPVLRYLSYAIDTTLLTAALMLLTILPASVHALRGATRRRWACFAGALLAFVWMFAVARAHKPLGLLGFWVGS